jgi:hypothetical protein
MYLQEIFDQLTYGELSQLSIGGGEAGVINEANYPRVLQHINLGLTALFKRFTLKEGRVKLMFVPGQTVYPVTSAHAQSNLRSREVNKYLVDTAALPFKDDILKIERVYADSGLEMDLNVNNSPYSFYTPNLTTLRAHPDVVAMLPSLPEQVKTTGVELVYRANHPKIVISLGMFDPTRVHVQLPDSHLAALLMFVASRAHNPIGVTNEFNAGNNYNAKYEAECQKLEDEDLEVNQGGGNNERFRRRGFV